MASKMLLISVLSACVAVCSACSCNMERGPGRYCGYNIVFRGMVIGVKGDEAEDSEDPEDPEEIYFNMYGDKVYIVRVDQAFLMPPDVTISENNTLELRTNKQGSMCGSYFPLRADNRIFFANTYGDDEARTHLCTPNTLWDNLDTEDQELIASNLAEFCSNHKQGIPIPNDITHEDTDSK